MIRTHRILIALLVGFSILPAAPRAASHTPNMAAFMSPAYPFELVAARKADRLAWLAYDQGRRNVYTAAAPDFKPVRLSQFLDDNGVDISGLSISDDGAVVTFVRGTAPNREGWIANPTSGPSGADRTVWAARTAGGAPWKLGEVTNPTLAPTGRSVVYAKDGQIYQYQIAAAAATTSAAASAPAEVRLKPDATRVGATDKAAKPLITAWGTNSNPRWSPDGTRIAFVSTRTDHSFIGVYNVRTRDMTFIAPSVDFDSSPTWSPDGKRIAFIRRPGTPFGQQNQQGTGSLGNPNGPAFTAAGRGQGGRGRGATTAAAPGRGGQRGGGGRGAPESEGGPAPIPGLTAATFKGGYTLSFMVADIASPGQFLSTGSSADAREFWHNQPDDKTFPTINAIQFADAGHVIFQCEPEEWIRYYSVRLKPDTAADRASVDPPVMLTPGDGMVENIGVSSDGKYLYYTTNARDIDHRHTWKVPTGGGEAVQLTRGDTIETYPAALASGKSVAVLSADARRPQSVGIVPAAGGDAKIIFPSPLPKEYPLAEHVVPQNVITKAPDGLEIHNQLFIPKDIKPGERRPAIIFVHGGPVRQMLLGYHYMHFYHFAYATNQWLASQGYIVMSVNYRSGIGYGKSFRTAPNVGGRGNAEYQDVLAGGQYLQSRSDVDPKRVGIWGLSYGGVLTAQALARNSDVFIAGVDLAGVHLWGNSVEPGNVSYDSSAIAAIDKWKSPVLLVHGDDDRNVNFAQTVGLVQLLRAHDVYHELIVFPDDTHESMLHKRWMYTFDRVEDFLRRFLKGESERRTSDGGKGR